MWLELHKERPRRNKGRAFTTILHFYWPAPPPLRHCRYSGAVGRAIAQNSGDLVGGSVIHTIQSIPNRAGEKMPCLLAPWALGPAEIYLLERCRLLPKILVQIKAYNAQWHSVLSTLVSFPQGCACHRRWRFVIRVRNVIPWLKCRTQIL